MRKTQTSEVLRVPAETAVQANVRNDNLGCLRFAAGWNSAATNAILIVFEGDLTTEECKKLFNENNGGQLARAMVTVVPGITAEIDIGPTKGPITIFNVSASWATAYMQIDQYVC